MALASTKVQNSPTVPRSAGNMFWEMRICGSTGIGPPMRVDGAHAARSAAAAAISAPSEAVCRRVRVFIRGLHAKLPKVCRGDIVHEGGPEIQNPGDFAYPPSALRWNSGSG